MMKRVASFDAAARPGQGKRWNMIGYSRAALISLALAGLIAVTPAFSQVQTGGAPQPDDRASAYYNFAMGHLYAELAGTYGNRGEYVNKAIDFYRQALKI